MKKIFLVTDFFMSEDLLPDVTTYAFENEKDAKEKFDERAKTILEFVEREFNSHSANDGEADAVYTNDGKLCEGYKDSACYDWWWWVKIEEKEVK